MIAQAEAETGLALPEDVETLLGESTALAIGTDIDPEALVNSEPRRVCRSASRSRVTRRRSRACSTRSAPRSGAESELLLSESDGDVVAIGPDEDYVAELLEDGGLGDSDAFQNVVREAERRQRDPLRQLRRG